MKKAWVCCSILWVILFVVLNACSSMKSSTKLIATWKDKSYGSGYVNSILIVGISEDTATRKHFEDTFVKHFYQAGIKALSGMAVVSPSKEMDKDTIKSAAIAEAMGTVLVTHLEASGEKKVYQPAPTGPPKASLPFGPYFDSVYSATQSSGIYKQRKYVKLISNLYETATEKLIWSGVSESIDPKSTERIIETLVEKVIKDMREKDLIR